MIGLQKSQAQLLTQNRARSDYSLDMIIAWMTTYLRAYAVMLYVICVVTLGLFGTNRLIINWNHAHDYPHGDHPYYLMFAVSVKKSRMKQKISAMQVMSHFHRMHGRNKTTNKKMGLLNSISMALKHTRDIFSLDRIVVRCRHAETICVCTNKHSFLFMFALLMFYHPWIILFCVFVSSRFLRLILPGTIAWVLE